MTIRSAVFLAIMLLVSSPVLAWTGKVVEVSDARTMNIERNGDTVTVSLYGISCPEPGEPFGDEALELVSTLVLDQEVAVTPHREMSGRILAEVVPQETGASLNALLLRKGLAWVHEAYCEIAQLCGSWERIQGQASSAKRGIWSEVPENMPAWRWLKERGME